MSEIADFLRARYAERRAIAEAAANLQCDPENGWGITDTSNYAPTEKRRWISPHIGMLHEVESAEHIVANNPAVVIADCDAKLAIIDEHPAATGFDGNNVSGTVCRTCGEINYDGELTGDPYPCRTLRLLAQPFARVGRYRPEWALELG